MNQETEFAVSYTHLDVYKRQVFSLAVAAVVVVGRHAILRGIFGSIDADVMRYAETYFLLSALSLSLIHISGFFLFVELLEHGVLPAVGQLLLLRRVGLPGSGQMCIRDRACPLQTRKRPTRRSSGILWWSSPSRSFKRSTRVSLYLKTSLHS